MSNNQSFPKRLHEGYSSFRGGNFLSQSQRFQELATAGQKPETMIISCCDSRAAPETVFDCAPGEIFVLRNVANLVPPFHDDGDPHGTWAALEFAVTALKVENIVVMGHAQCGGIAAALAHDFKPLSDGNFVGNWVADLESLTAGIEAEFDDPEGRQREMEWASIRNSIKNLMAFPVVQAAVEAGTLSLHGAWFSIFNGEMWTMDSSGVFSPPKVLS